MTHKDFKKFTSNKNLELLKEYPFQRLKKLLKDINIPKDKKEIILSIGEPRHKPPAFIKEILNKNFSKWEKYPPTIGTNKLNIACIKWLNRRFSLPAKYINENKNIVQVAGTREGLFNIALALNSNLKNNEQSAILIPEPFYQVYAGAARISGGQPIFVESLKKNKYIPDFSSVNSQILKRTSIIYICSPSNPEGASLNLDDWNNLIHLTRKIKATLVVDECYTDIYTKKPPIGPLEACVKLNTNINNIISFHSLSKRSNVPGFRSGFAVGDEKIIYNYKKLRQYCAGQQPIPIQEAATALWNDDEHSKKNRLKYIKKFKIAENIFGKKFDFYIPNGGFYLWLNVGNGEKATKLLWHKKAIKVMPGAYLSTLKNSKKYIRVALVTNLKETKSALQEIYNLLDKT